MKIILDPQSSSDGLFRFQFQLTRDDNCLREIVDYSINWFLLFKVYIVMYFQTRTLKYFYFTKMMWISWHWWEILSLQEFCSLITAVIIRSSNIYAAYGAASKHLISKVSLRKIPDINKEIVYLNPLLFYIFY